MLTAPADLPDGDYIAYFAGFSLIVTRAKGIWISQGIAVRDASARGLDAGRSVYVVDQTKAADASGNSDEKVVEASTSPERPSR